MQFWYNISMKISGFQKLSLVDFDGHISATVFVSGCNFACPFCHNAGLVKGLEPVIPEDEVLEYLQKRFGLLDSVCVSGGEPTLYPDLPQFISKLKNIGYLIKLDTNGTNPEMVQYLVQNKLIDYIAMDIKNGLDEYNKTIGKEYNLDTINKSIKYIMSCGIDYEFRTTLVNGLHSKKSIEDIAKLIKGANKYYLQKFEDSGNCIASGLSAISKDEAKSYLEYLIQYIPNTHLRGY